MAEKQSIGEYLKQLREAHKPKWTQRDVARHLEIPEERYRSYEYDRVRLPEDVAQKLSIEYGVTTSSLYEAGDSAERVNIVPGPTVALRILGPINAGDGDAPPIDEETLYVPIEFDMPGYAGLRLYGDSMMPGLQHGDIVVFKPAFVPRVNSIVAAELEDRTWVIKRAQFSDGQWTLESDNPSYDGVKQAWTVKGLLVGLVREEGMERMTRHNTYGLAIDR